MAPHCRVSKNKIGFNPWRALDLKPFTTNAKQAIRQEVSSVNEISLVFATWIAVSQGDSCEWFFGKYFRFRAYQVRCTCAAQKKARKARLGLAITWCQYLASPYEASFE